MTDANKTWQPADEGRLEPMVGRPVPERALLTLDLAGMLAFGGFVPQEAVDDAIAHDGGKTMEKIRYLTYLINALMCGSAT
jgi:hypothetical protein